MQNLRVLIDHVHGQERQQPPDRDQAGGYLEILPTADGMNY